MCLPKIPSRKVSSTTLNVDSRFVKLQQTQQNERFASRAEACRTGKRKGSTQMQSDYRKEEENKYKESTNPKICLKKTSSQNQSRLT